MPEVKKKRHRLTDMRYDEISFVDRGANQHAHVMIVKRDSEVSKRPLGADDNGYLPKSSSTPPARKADWYASDRAPTKSGSGKGAKSERAQHWKEGKHPRNPKGSGSPRGGTFKSTSAESKKKYGKGGTTKAKQDAAKKGDKSYVVKKGDTLWALAQKYYGDGTKWKLIAKANGIKDPRKLPIGKKLTIPGTGTKDKQTKAKHTNSSSNSPGERLTMEPGGKVHWEKTKAPRNTSSTRKPATKKPAAKRPPAKKKKSTRIEKVAAQIMFDSYTGRR